MKKVIIAAIASLTIAGGVGSFTEPAHARGGGHWGGGHWGGGHWGGGHWRGGGWGRGWGWGAAGLGLATGLALGAAPYYGAYAYGPYPADCYIQRRWVVNAYGNRVLRNVRVCY